MDLNAILKVKKVFTRHNLPLPMMSSLRHGFKDGAVESELAAKAPENQIDARGR